MKKLNAVLSWLLTAVITGHIIITSYSYKTWSYFPKLTKGFAYSTMLLVIIHAAVSIMIFFFCHDGSALNKYKKLNARTVIQRISCLLIILLVHLHTTAFSALYTGTALTPAHKAFIIVTEILFFGSVLTHLAVSFSRSLITMGLIRSEKAEKTWDIVAYVYCAVLMAAPLICIIPAFFAS